MVINLLDGIKDKFENYDEDHTLSYREMEWLIQEVDKGKTAQKNLYETVNTVKSIVDENEAYRKQVKRLTKRSAETGIALSDAKNYIRELDGDFEQYNKRERKKHKGGI